MKGILLVNLGSPDSTKTKDVRKYLDEFLMDKRVIDSPYLIRSFIVRGIILNTRPKKSAEAYKKIWWDEGSPLIVISKRLQQKVQKLTKHPVSLAMRYGNPSIKDGISELHKKGVTEILLLPLYPQFAMATTETILAKAVSIKNKFFKNISIKSIDSFYNRPEYTLVLAKSISDFLTHKKWDKILFSYHGIPERHIYKSDITKEHCKIDSSCCNSKSEAHKFCYRHQCYQTTKNVVEHLNLSPNQYLTSFQSRLGKDPWLQPYTDATIEKLAKDGIENLAVVTPAFVADCLETLEEIGMEGKEEFIQAGGKEFHTIPCLNDSDHWASTIAKWINE